MATENIIGLLRSEATVGLAGQPTERVDALLQRARRVAASQRGGLLPVSYLPPGEPVLLLESDPARFLLSFAALLYMDLVPVPLDPRTGVATFHKVLASTVPTTTLHGQGVGAELHRELLCATSRYPLEKFLELPAGTDAPALEPPARGGDDAALMIYTSGSTGSPKGVVLSHRNVCSSVAAILDYLPLERSPHSGVVLPLHYGYALIGQLLVTLAAGGRVTFLSQLRFPGSILDGLRQEGVTGLSSVPTSLRLLCDVATEDGAAIDGLGYVASAGARMPPDLPGRLRQVFPGARLFNQYGCTEAAPRVSYLEDSDPAFEQGSVGRPIRGLDLAILRDGGDLAAVGEEGDIGIRGPNVTQGYFRRGGPPAGAATRQGYLLTGDVGSLDGQGRLFLAGRRDRIVKCAGERVSLEEVEQAARSHASVEDAAAVALDHALLGAQVVALVQGDEARLPDLQRHLVGALGPAKRPARLVYVQRIPRSSTGKLQQEALERLARQDPRSLNAEP